MFKTPYNTTSLKDYDIQKIVKDIESVSVSQQNNEDLRQMSEPDSSRLLPIFELLPHADYIGAFTQPIVIRKKDEDTVVVDVRPLVRESRIGEITVASKSDYKMLAYYGTMCSTWINDGESVLHRSAAFAGRIYVSWLSGLITRNLNLDMLSQVQLKVITGMFFECLFIDSDEPEVNIREKQRLAVSAGKYSYSNTANAEDILKDVPMMQTIKDYIAVLHTVSPRFEALTQANLFAMVSRSWFGASAPILCAVALEYPPAFYTMVYFALNYKGYNNTGVGNIVYATRTSPEAKQFKTGIERLFDEAMV